MIKATALLLMATMCGIVIHLFWTNEFQYYQTPKLPAAAPQVGSLLPKLAIDEILSGGSSFIHFYDAECLMSQVNMPHVVNSLLAKQSKGLNKIVVYRGKNNSEQLRADYNLPSHVRLIQDPDFSLANSMGIVSTPYAAIIESKGTLYFRGNYLMSTGICGPTNISTSAPALALSRIEKESEAPIFPSYQTLAWGCQF